MGILRLPRSIRTVGLITLTIGACGCAALRLNGCTKLAVCGERAAYTCGDDLVCATRDGETVSSEPVTSSHKPCHICANP